ncbi:acetyl-CoA C-acetyltransferase [Pseudofrankia asymbiotica]|uniref:Acetyl-CoA acetyltransferase n=1 Tax=Pseudofrankia asymbiotica TaxID=1834516 RepID=A0A1V2I7S0_9ACTN|nr:acetyl-CoA C-acetyltransferase [Pseudofrankia asymbiotica]ONH26425.1 acetyl-CoA acetyltransferase [Pseudofrankia asymbiotica]
MEAFIVAASRTPIGRAHKGSLAGCRPDDLSALVIRSLLEKVPALSPDEVEDVIWGSALPRGEQSGNIARIASILSGVDSPGTTVSRACGSSLQTIRMAAHAIRALEGDVFIAGGVECVSRVPANDPIEKIANPLFADARKRTEARTNAAPGPWTPPGGLPDIYITMGQTAENVASLTGITREEQDAFACRSQELATESQKNGYFAAEIVPVTTPDGDLVVRDDGPRPGTTVEVLAGLKPAFRVDGSVTAGNSCPLNDGSAAVIVMSERRVRELDIEPIGRVVSTGVSSLDPEIMGLGPIEASRQAMTRAGLTMDDIDLVEINEAFAVQVLGSARELEIPLEKLNVHGGGIALGHPFGMTGARIMTTLLHGLSESGGRYGLETMCVGGGQGMAMIVERL